MQNGLRVALLMVALASCHPAPAPPVTDSAVAAAPMRNWGSTQAEIDSAVRVRDDSIAKDQAQRRSQVRVVATKGVAWFEAHRAIDVTGDGVVDDVVIRALGHRSDSLQIHLFAIVDRDTAELARWNSDYELVDPPFPRDTAPAVRDVYMRDRLNEVLAGVSPSMETINQGSFDMNPAGDCEGDVAECLRQHWGLDSIAGRDVAAELARGPVPLVNFGYGYETASEVVWAQSIKRFLGVASCC